MTMLKASDISHVAKLAKLKLNKHEIEMFQNQLSQIVDYVSRLEKVDTTSVVPTAQTTGLVDVVREDETDHTQSLNQEEALCGTQKHVNGHFVVPAVISKEQ